MLPLRDRLPTRRTPWVVYALLALNIGVFVWMRWLKHAGVDPGVIVHAWGFVPARLWIAPGAELGHVLTSMFLHDPSGWVHIGGNMLFLWIFGDNVEDAMGSLRFGLFYLIGGVVAAGAQMAIDPHAVVPMIGASGAISAVLAAYGSLYPRSPITVLNPVPLLWIVYGVVFRLPAWFVILEYFVGNLLSALLSVGSRGGGVAFFAHLGGFVAGILLVRWFAQRAGIGSNRARSAPRALSHNSSQAPPDADPGARRDDLRAPRRSTERW